MLFWSRAAPRVEAAGVSWKQWEREQKVLAEAPISLGSVSQSPKPFN